MAGRANKDKGTFLSPGDRIDRFELVKMVAQGGMGAVWLARVERGHGFEKHFALKTILPQFAADPVFRTMFLDEARISAAISHANVAQILDLGQQGETLYMVMEWVEGETLHVISRVYEHRSARMPPAVLLRIAADASAGLHAVHELRDKAGVPLEVIHRDVSPQNILVSTEGVAKIIDFGVAKARGRLAGDTRVGALKGKLRYMAPEQARGGAIDRRADVFGLGALLYHLLSGVPAFDGTNEAHTIQRLLSGDPPDPLPDYVPRVVAAVVMRALAFEPEQRHATAAELGRDIERAAEATGLAATVGDVAALLRELLGTQGALTHTNPPGPPAASPAGRTDQATPDASREQGVPEDEATTEGFRVPAPQALRAPRVPAELAASGRQDTEPLRSQEPPAPPARVEPKAGTPTPVVTWRDRIRTALGKSAGSAPAKECLICSSSCEDDSILCVACWDARGSAASELVLVSSRLDALGLAPSPALYDVVHGQRPLVRLEPSRARAVVERLAARGVRARTVPLESTLSLIPRDLLAILGAIVATGALAGFVASSLFFLASPAVAGAIFVLAARAMRAPALEAPAPRTSLPRDVEAAVAEAFGRVTGEPRSMLVRVLGLARKISVRAPQKSAGEMVPAAGALLKATSEALVELARLDRLIASQPAKSPEQERLEETRVRVVLVACDAIDMLAEIVEAAFFLPDPQTIAKMNRVARAIGFELRGDKRASMRPAEARS